MIMKIVKICTDDFINIGIYSKIMVGAETKKT